MLTVDFGDEIGMRRASAQITDLYQNEELVEKQIVGVVNFPPKQIGPFMSECLVCGFVQADGSVVLAVPDKPVTNGLRLA
jgi:tRNA-binding protein